MIRITRKICCLAVATVLVSPASFAAGNTDEGMTDTEAVAALFEEALDAQKLPEKAKRQPVKKRVQEYTGDRSLRTGAIRENAFTRGVAEGRQLGFRTQQKMMEGIREDLDRIYDVSNLYLENGTLQPPVILTGDNLLEMAPDGRSYKHVGNRREIVSPARYVTEKLNWRSYLISESDLLLPDDYYDYSLKSKTSGEAEEEKRYYRLGLEEGKRQAYEEVADRVSKLTGIVLGMRQGYKEMMAGTATLPQTVSTYDPVAGGGNKIEVGVRRRSIASDASFVTDLDQGRAFIGTHKRRE